MAVTNGAVASVAVSDSFGNQANDVNNQGFTNGGLRACFKPLWLGEPTWKLRLELARPGNFPGSKQWMLTVTNRPLGAITQQAATKHFSGVAFRAIRAVAGELEMPGGGYEDIPTKQLHVEAQDPRDEFHRRLMELVDQAGSSVAWKRAEWGGAGRWRLTDSVRLSDGIIQSVTAKFSREPKVPFEFFVHPTITTHFADRPRRP